MDPGKVMRALIGEVAKHLDADLLLYTGAIDRDQAKKLILLPKKHRSENVALFLTTYGGDADAAYRIARFLQDRYKRLTIFVDSYCKSAGTLLALGSDELVVSDTGELGPLDVQVRKRDEVGERSSGLTLRSALTMLQDQAFEAFQSTFLEVRRRSGLQITTATAADMAVKLAVGLFGPVYAQIDPMSVGEYERATDIAFDYGDRLAQRGNVKPEALARLISGYSAHGFVIDRKEAESMFRHVRAPSDVEKHMMLIMTKIWPLDDEDVIIYIDELFSEEDNADKESGDADVKPQRSDASPSESRAEGVNVITGECGEQAPSTATAQGADNSGGGSGDARDGQEENDGSTTG